MKGRRPGQHDVRAEGEKITRPPCIVLLKIVAMALLIGCPPLVSKRSRLNGDSADKARGFHGERRLLSGEP